MLRHLDLERDPFGLLEGTNEIFGAGHEGVLWTTAGLRRFSLY
jgi:hypothetical protein